MKIVMSELDVKYSILAGRISSLVVAEGLNKKHSHIMALIATHKEQLELLGDLVEEETISGLARFEERIGEKLSYKHKEKTIQYAMLTDYQIIYLANKQASTPFIRDFVEKVLFAFTAARETQA